MTKAGRRGRKPARESRSAEIRQGIGEWKQTPEGKRQPPTLTELAAELGISHQLASYYASRAPTEYERQSEEYHRKAQAIIDRAHREGRFMMPAEREEMLDCYRASLQAMVPLARKRAKHGNKLAKRLLRVLGVR
jgi:hypothetical protein